MKRKPEIKKGLRDKIVFAIWHGNGYWSAARYAHVKPRVLRRYRKLHKDFDTRLKKLRAEH